MLGAQLYVKSDGTKLSMEHHHKCRRGLGEAPAQGGRRKQRTPGHKKAYSHTHPLPHKQDSARDDAYASWTEQQWWCLHRCGLNGNNHVKSCSPITRISEASVLHPGSLILVLGPGSQQPGGTEIGTAPIQNGHRCQGYRLEGPNCKNIFVSCFLAQF
jgi:hypothetical protein